MNFFRNPVTRLLERVCRRLRGGDGHWPLERREALAEAQRIAGIGSWRLYVAGNRMDWSEQSYRIMGVSPVLYTPTVDGFFERVHPADVDRLNVKWDEALQGAPLQDIEIRVRRADGAWRCLYLRAVPEFNDAGRVTCLVGTVEDITERRQREEQLRYYRQLVEGSDDMSGICDADYRYVLVNHAYARRYGMLPSQLVGRHLREIIGEQQFASLQPAIDRCFDGENQRLETRRYYEGLGWRHLLVRYYLVAVPHDAGRYVAAIITDITVQRQAESELREQSRLLDMAGRVGRFGGWTVDVASGRMTGSAVVDEIHGAPPGSEPITMDDMYRLYAPDSRERLRRVFTACVEQGTPYHEELELVRPDGGCVWVRTVAEPVFDDRGRVIRVQGALQDITERKRAEQELNRLAYEDQLTGLFTRNGFTRDLTERLARSGWNPEGLVAMLDVQDQRDVNDVYGYESGDALLAALGERLRKQAGPDGLAGRIGGDEFVLFMPLGAGEYPEQRLQALTTALAEPFDVQGIELEVSVFLGYTCLGGRSRAVESLLREAELALFHHRSEGEKPWVAYTVERSREAHQRIRLTRELRDALGGGQFELHFQPKVRLDTGELIDCEALLRWQHPLRGLQPPGEFIPIAERSQLIVPIGDWVLREACRQLREWRDAGLELVRVSVNVSLVQFLVEDFATKVRNALREFAVDPAALSLEITESVFERESESLQRQVGELHDMGVRLSLDDFGTGYSSLLYLQKYPFDEIKIDQGFVRRLLEDPYSRKIVSTVMSLAGALGADVVAEGIESAAVRDALLEMGCRAGQGYYYSMPLAAEDFYWLLEQHGRLPLVGGGVAG